MLGCFCHHTIHPLSAASDAALMAERWFWPLIPRSANSVVVDLATNPLHPTSSGLVSRLAGWGGTMHGRDVQFPESSQSWLHTSWQLEIALSVASSCLAWMERDLISCSRWSVQTFPGRKHTKKLYSLWLPSSLKGKVLDSREEWIFFFQRLGRRIKTEYPFANAWEGDGTPWK